MKAGYLRLTRETTYFTGADQFNLDFSGPTASRLTSERIDQLLRSWRTN